MELDTKLYITGSDGKKYMGIGVLWLLEEIDKSKSLRSASINMGLSYSKAYGMLKRLEEEVGRPFVERKRGGASREGLELTPFARNYMELYREFQTSAKVAAEKEFVSFRYIVVTLIEEDRND
mgnify:FL=1